MLKRIRDWFLMWIFVYRYFKEFRKEMKKQLKRQGVQQQPKKVVDEEQKREYTDNGLEYYERFLN